MNFLGFSNDNVMLNICMFVFLLMEFNINDRCLEKFVDEYNDWVYYVIEMYYDDVEFFECLVIVIYDWLVLECRKYWKLFVKV